MQNLHERFLAAIAAERQRTASRRRFLTGSAKLAGGGALAIAAFGAPFARAVRPVAAQNFADDIEILNYALTLEHLEASFYRDGLETLGADAFTDAGRPANVFGLLEEIRDHELAHVETLTGVITDLGGTPAEEGTYEFGYDDVDGFLEVGAALESTGVAAYAGAAPQIQDPGLLAAALGIHSVEARHAAYLNARVEVSPFPNVIDEALDPADVLERIPAGRFADPNEIGAMVNFLASPDAAYCTGSSHVVDGGMLLMGPQAGSHLQSDDWRTP